MNKLDDKRCAWVQGKPDYYVAYHDDHWGKPEHDDRQLFRWLVLESFHVGLSWQLILSKSAAFDAAFDHFDYHRIANYGQDKVEALVQDVGIVRHRGKINATIANAQAFLKIQQTFGSFDAYIWSFTNGETIVNQTDEFLTKSPLSDAIAKDLKQRGFKFLGSVTVYAYLQAIGIINDHELNCPFR
ncbi:DNA-3-methyladenine glycosylase I [Aerococcaceae bacterium NML171108]|nr:DNA-3-methyladenine glycosylase I [Aerococcaceae bacterium NML171108]